jgi:hypothetical protein
MRVLYSYYDPAVEQTYTEDFGLPDFTWQQAFDHCMKHLPMDHVDYLEFKFYP